MKTLKSIQVHNCTESFFSKCNSSKINVVNPNKQMFGVVFRAKLLYLYRCRYVVSFIVYSLTIRVIRHRVPKMILCAFSVVVFPIYIYKIYLGSTQNQKIQLNFKSIVASDIFILNSFQRVRLSAIGGTTNQKVKLIIGQIQAAVPARTLLSETNR